MKRILCLIFVFLLPFASAQVLHYTLDQDSNSVIDASGNGNVGVVNGATFISDGWAGGAFSFDGVDDYIRIPYSESWSKTVDDQVTEYTVAAWVRLRQNEGYKPVFQIESDLGQVHLMTRNGGWSYAIDTEGGPRGWDCLSNTDVVDYVQNPDDTWHHIAVTVNTEQSRCILYSDGVQIDYDTYVDGYVNLPPSDMDIGGNSVQATHFLNGDIDDFRIYLRELGASEVTDLAVGRCSPSEEVCDGVDNDCDGVVDEDCSGSLEGDLNGDGVVDISDVLIVAGDIGKSSNFDSRADRNNDGVVNVFDLVLVARYFGSSQQPDSDTAAPVRSDGAPSGTLSAGTTSATLSLSTDESATCRFSTSSGAPYSGMTQMSSTGTTSHSHQVSGLSDGQSYDYFVKCRDSIGNINSADYVISFSVSSSSVVCGDGVIEGDEECDLGGSNGVVCSPGYGSSCTYCSGSCTNVTVNGSYCGDGVCDTVEDHSSCGSDCSAPVVCGDGVCDVGESCVSDCGVQTFDGPAELPRAEVDFTMPSVTNTVTVKPSGGDFTSLQAAWDSITSSGRSGNIEIVVDAGYNPGSLSTGAQAGDDSYWVVVRSSNSGNLPQNVRVGPGDKPDMAQLVVPAGGPAISVGSGTKRVRFVGISTETDSSSYLTYHALSENSAEYIIFDRCLADGGYSRGEQSRIGYGLNGQNIGVIDSYLFDINQDRYESKAILTINGAGPYTFVNNFLEAGAINILFGGADPGSEALIPRDITFVRNYLYKNPNWASDSNVAVKNSFEIKHGIRFLVENNALENSWDVAQGYMVNIKSADGYGGIGYARYVTFRYNTLENFDGGITLAAQPTNSNTGLSALYPLRNVSVHDNRGVNGGFDNPFYDGPTERAVALGGGIEYLNIQNNDIRGDFNNGVTNEGGGKTDLVFEDNIIGTNNYVFQNGGSLDSMAPGHSVTGNILDDGGWNILPSGNCLSWPPPDANCPDAGVRVQRHSSTKSGDFSSDPWY